MLYAKSDSLRACLEFTKHMSECASFLLRSTSRPDMNSAAARQLNPRLHMCLYRIQIDGLEILVCLIFVVGSTHENILQ